MPERPGPPIPEDEILASIARERAEQEERAAEQAPGATLAVELVGPARGRWRQAVLLPALAILAALGVGALVIIFTNDEALGE